MRKRETLAEIAEQATKDIPIPPLPFSSQILTEEILLSLGFEIANTDVCHFNQPIYRIKNDKYLYHIEIQMEPRYREGNPNKGILSLYKPAGEALGISKEIWSEEDQKRADEYRIPYPMFRRHIAWGVTTVGRLKALYKALTEEELIEK